MDFVSYTDSGYGYMAGVELMSVGMEWPASTGDYTATFEQLADIVIAANDDPLVQVPRIKLGHTSDVGGQPVTVNPFAAIGDAEPVFGRIINLRLENDGATLVGDFIEVPEWLADGMPSAYPNRSSEPWLSVTTPGGKQYAAILTAVALLGEPLPAIKDLEDLQRLMDGGPQAVAASEEARVPEQLSVSVGTIRDRFNWEIVADADWFDEADTYWWWARDVRVDPNELIVDDDEGNLWLVPFSTDGEDDVTYDQPQQVREVYVPVNASGSRELYRTTPVRAGQRVLASNLDRPNKPDPKSAAASASAREGEDTVPEIDMEALRRRLGLDEDATEEQINEALAKEPEPAEPEPAEPEGPEAEQPEAEPVAASTLPEGMVAVPADQWERVQAGAKAGTELASQAEQERRDQTIQAATGKGKVRPADRESLVNLHTANRDAFYRLLTADVKDGGLAPGLVPVEEFGATPSDTDQPTATGWFPQLANKEA